tara:strand:+ start:1011 stop:1292 length:282 start_codon:yes stop_codon:yes gene_type:complete
MGNNMNILSMISKVTGGSKIVENVAGLVVGENSKKRNIGFAGFAVTFILFQMDYINVQLFDTLILVCAGWTGMAFSNKLTKLGDALKESKKKK